MPRTLRGRSARADAHTMRQIWSFGLGLSAAPEKDHANRSGTSVNVCADSVAPCLHSSVHDP